MNIVFLFSDEHAGSVMGNSGHPVVQTPHLDRLSEQSYTFDNAYCNYPICTPSRLSMLTGRYPHQIEAWDLGAIADRRYETWGDYFAKADYETVLCGRTHFNGTDRLLGFSYRMLDDLHRWRHTTGRPPRRGPDARRGSNSHVTECGPGDHEHTRYDRNVTDLAVDFLREKAASSDEKPFLLYCGFMHPHFPLIAPPEFYSLYDPDTLELPETWNERLESQHPIIQHHRWAWRNDIPPPEATVRCALAAYYALVSALDAQIGRILEAIDTSPLREDTVVIYTSDHGEMAGHHGIWQKQCFYEPAVKVPLMLRLPSGETRRVAQNVSLVDVLPTLLEVAGLETPSDLPGDSLLEIARNQPVKQRAPFFQSTITWVCLTPVSCSSAGITNCVITLGASRSCSTWTLTHWRTTIWHQNLNMQQNVANWKPPCARYSIQNKKMPVQKRTKGCVD